MKTNRKHGFTVVELVVVIAIIAVLAAVLIPTFASIIKKANDSAYLQERTNQQIADLAEKVEKINYFTWEDFEKKLAEELAKVDTVSQGDVKAAVDAALKEYAAYSQASMTGLTADQVKKIVDEAMAGQLTTAQVEAIVKAAVGSNKSVDVNAIANQVIAKLPKTTGITKEEMQKAINEALNGVEGVKEEDIAKALAAFGVSTLTEADINSIISSATADNTTLAKALNIRLANLGIGKQKTVYDMVVKIGGESVITGTNTTSTVLDDTSTLLYDLDSNKFFTVKDGVVDYDGGLSLSGELTEKYKYWIFSKVTSETYSTYLLSGSDVTSAEVTKGIDVGYKTDVTSITYTNPGSAQTVVIRTNGGTLTVNAKNDNVLHYGYADSVNVIDVATASYHENGTVKFLEVAAGHIVLEETSEVSAVHFDATNGKFENADGKTISIDLSKVNTDDISFSRDAVTIAENGTYVAEVTTDGTEYIWLFGNGIKEQMVVTDTTDPIAENGTLKSGITAGAEDGSVAEQIANPAKRNAEGQLVNANNEVVSVENAVVEEVASKEDVQAGATLFAGGTGTQADPFLIVDYDTFQHVSDLYDEGYYYFKVKDGIASISLQDNKNVRLNGSFNGNGVKFTNVNAGIFGVVGTKTATSKEVLLENFIVDFVGGEGVVRSCGTPDLTFKNIDVTGYMLTEWNAGLFLRYGTANVSDGFDYTVSFDDCSARAEVYSSTNTFSAILIGHGYQGANNTLTINLDSDTDNNINSTVLYFTGNGTPFGNKYYCMTSGDVVVNIDGVEQYRGGYAGFTANKMTGSNVVAIVNGKNPTKTSEGAYQLTPESDTSKVVVSINWQYTEWEKDYTEKIANLAGVGGTFSDKIVFEVNGNDPIKLLDKITAVEIRLGQEEWGYEIVNGKIILNMTNTNSYIDGHVTLIVEQFTGASNIAKYRGSFELATKDKGNDWIIK